MAALDAANEARLAAAAKAAKPLTQAEIDARTAAVVAAGGKSTDPNNRIKEINETAAQANARINAGYKAQTKPELTQEGAAAGATIQFVRTGAGGVGTYKEIFPIGVPIPTERSTAYGNTYDAQGNLISGTGKKVITDPASLAKVGSNIFQMLGGILYFSGKPFTGVEGGVTYKDGVEVKVDNSNPKGKKEVSRVDNGDGTFTVTYDDKSTEIIGTKRVVGDTTVKPTKTLIETRVDSKTGNTIGYFSDGSQEVLNQGTGPVQSQEFKNAYALLEATFRDYGLESLVPAIKSYMERDLGPEQATLELRSSPEYIARFKGNQMRLAAGKNALREDIYLATERAYDETLTSYGQANYFGIDRQAKQLKMAQIIGNDISADEFKSRVDLAVARVTNADPTIKKLLKDFYPSINDGDLVGYFLNPAEGLPKLTEKVTSAEIGSAFLGQGLAYTQQRSTELAQYGIDRAGALKGAAEVKEALPQTQKFADVYGEAGIDYTQQTAEEEFLKNNQDAATKRKRLASMERGSFSGSAGNAPGAYSTGYLKKSSAAGLI